MNRRILPVPALLVPALLALALLAADDPAPAPAAAPDAGAIHVGVEGLIGAGVGVAVAILAGVSTIRSGVVKLIKDHNSDLAQSHNDLVHSLRGDNDGLRDQLRIVTAQNREQIEQIVGLQRQMAELIRAQAPAVVIQAAPAAAPAPPAAAPAPPAAP